MAPKTTVASPTIASPKITKKQIKSKLSPFNKTTLGTLLNKYTDAKYDLTTIVDDKEVSKPSLIDAVFEHCWSENVHFKKMEDGSVSDPLPFTKMAVGAKS